MKPQTTEATIANEPQTEVSTYKVKHLTLSVALISIAAALPILGFVPVIHKFNVGILNEFYHNRSVLITDAIVIISLTSGFLGLHISSLQEKSRLRKLSNSMTK